MDKTTKGDSHAGSPSVYLKKKYNGFRKFNTRQKL